jgi:hypothetical protein
MNIKKEKLDTLFVFIHDLYNGYGEDEACMWNKCDACPCTKECTNKDHATFETCHKIIHDWLLA